MTPNACTASCVASPTTRLLDTDLAHEIATSVAFRNVLVHGYAEVDDSLVVGNLDRLDDLAEYVSTLASLVGASGE